MYCKYCKEIVPEFEHHCCVAMYEEPKEAPESHAFAPGNYRVIDGELFKVEEGSPCLDCVQLRAELETANENAKLWFDTAAEKAGELETARQEMDRMTGAVIDNQWNMDTGEDENHWCHFCGSDIGGPHEDCPAHDAAKIREKYGFDKPERGRGESDKKGCKIVESERENDD